MPSGPNRIAVVGIGGAGANAVSRLADVGLPGACFIAADTSTQTLARAMEATTIQLSAGTRGLGTGGDVRIGALAALGAKSELRRAVAPYDLVFVVAGLAGGTGGGAAPELARACREHGVVTVGFGIMPFSFEAGARHEAARDALSRFRETCDTTIVMENDRALELVGDGISLDVALRVADDVLRQAVQGIGELLAGCGWINLDLATVQRVLVGGGAACLALGIGRDEAPALAAMRSALASPLSDMRALVRARSVLVQVSGGPDLTVAETADAIALLRSRLGPSVELLVGSSFDPTLKRAAQVTVLGTGISTAPDSALKWVWPSEDRKLVQPAGQAV